MTLEEELLAIIERRSPDDKRPARELSDVLGEAFKVIAKRIEALEKR